jgi:hypothetical protein
MGHPQAEGLAALGGCLEGLVEHRPVVLPGTGLDVPPVDPEVDRCGGRVIGVGQVTVELLIFDRVALGPADPGIEGIPVEALEGVEADSRIIEDVVNLFRANDQLIGGGLGDPLRQSGQGGYEQQVQHGHQFTHGRFSL